MDNAVPVHLSICSHDVERINEGMGFRKECLGQQLGSQAVAATWYEKTAA